MLSVWNIPFKKLSMIMKRISPADMLPASMVDLMVSSCPKSMVPNRRYSNRMQPTERIKMASRILAGNFLSLIQSQINATAIYARIKRPK